jgi:hypothetical protein
MVSKDNIIMKKQKVLEKIDQAWTAFRESYEGLTAEQMSQPGVIGEWSVKDVVCHVSCWEEEALKYLPHTLHGDRLPRYSSMYGGIDGFNAMMTEQKRVLTLTGALCQLDEIHARLLEYLQGISEEQFATEARFNRRLRLDTYTHYSEHTDAINAWRQRG